MTRTPSVPEDVTPGADPALARVLELWAPFHQLGVTEQLLAWDQETKMPRQAHAARGEQLALLAELRHERITSQEMCDAIASALESPSVQGRERSQVEEASRLQRRAGRVPTALAIELARARSAGLEAWQRALADDQFAAFQEPLETLVDLKRQEAEATAGSDAAPLYDALIEEYEPGLGCRDIEPLFDDLVSELSALVAEYAQGPDAGALAATGPFPATAQVELGRHLAGLLGFDFERGRLDRSAHPFCSGLGRDDVRLTWRADEADFRPCLFGILHEVGHGLYEQGIPAELQATPLGEASSLGVHESQSRLWENHVGRSRAFWRGIEHVVHEYLPQTSAVDVDTLWQSLHTVRPSLIRVEADEATYNLHIVLRFRLELALIGGHLEVRDLPGAWNDGIRDLLGIDVPSDRLGVLQDIHWASGLFGYFPTYTLGTLLAAQLFDAAEEQIGSLNERFERLDFAELLGWLRTEIHTAGATARLDNVARSATGRPLSPDSFLRHLRSIVRRISS